MLDAFAGLDLGVLRGAWTAQREARATLAEAEAALARAAAEEEFLRHAVAELDKLDPQQGEDEALDARRRLMQGAGRIRDDVAKALSALSDEGAEGRMRDALRWLDGAAEKAEGRLEAPRALPRGCGRDWRRLMAGRLVWPSWARWLPRLKRVMWPRRRG